MRMIFTSGLKGENISNPEAIVTQIRDFGDRGVAMRMQRLMIFAVALALQALCLNLAMAALSFVLIAVCETFDARTFAKAQSLRFNDPEALHSTLRQIHATTFLGSCLISYLALSVALFQHDSGYFMPMFFLVAAAIFAATNYHQLLSVLIIRLGLYCATFITIPLLNLMSAGASATHDAWLSLLTSMFVLYFIIDCSAIGLRYYRTSKHQLNQLRIENDRATHALAAKTEFLSTVSHELRTPLTSIRASLDMALAGAFGPLPEKSEKVLSIARRNATRLNKLIDELLDLQKIEVGMMKFDFSNVQLASLISDAVTDNQSYAQDLDVSLKMLPVDTDIVVRADPMRLEQVLTNLLSNAAKFSDAGSEVTLAVTATATRVRISVSDCGVGIDPADRPRIFDSFSQIDNVDMRKVSGTGLGLNISKRIVEAHDGIIDFAANEGRGTTFYLELARAAPQNKAHHQPALIKTAH